MCPDAAVVANRHPPDRIDERELADPRVVANRARLVTVDGRELMNASVVPDRKVSAANLHTFADVGVIANSDARSWTTIWAADTGRRVNHCPDTDMKALTRHLRKLRMVGHDT
jgi:hypothetical protein